jgi:hypothetical protein
MIAQSSAHEIMLSLNPHALAGRENGWEVFIEDVTDADGRIYRLEYRCKRSGRSARAFCLYSPWPPASLPLTDSHLMPDRSICTSAQAHRGGDPLDYAVARARFWCTGYSFLREHGIAETRRILGSDW